MEDTGRGLYMAALIGLVSLAVAVLGVGIYVASNYMLGEVVSVTDDGSARTVAFDSMSADGIDAALIVAFPWAYGRSNVERVHDEAETRDAEAGERGLATLAAGDDIPGVGDIVRIRISRDGNRVSATVLR